MSPDMNKRFTGFIGVLTLLVSIGIGFVIAGGPEPKSPVHADPFVDAMCSADGVCSLHSTSTIPLARPTSTVQTNATVVRVVDGDTFVATLDAEPGEFRIRMLGVNTPETVDPRRPVECFGKQASTHLKELIEGQRVRLESDPQADERDRYSRLLRNVVLEDGTDVNAALVRDGYAYAYLSYPLNAERKQELKKLQEIARASESGVWSPEVCSTSS
jgi:micrococcal nuclease